MQFIYALVPVTAVISQFQNLTNYIFQYLNTTISTEHHDLHFIHFSFPNTISTRPLLRQLNLEVRGDDTMDSIKAYILLAGSPACRTENHFSIIGISSSSSEDNVSLSELIPFPGYGIFKNDQWIFEPHFGMIPASDTNSLPNTLNFGAFTRKVPIRKQVDN